MIHDDDEQTKFEVKTVYNLQRDQGDTGDFDQTLLESHTGAPVTIEFVDGEAVTTIKIICSLPQNVPPLGEIIAHTFWELNKLNLSKESEIQVQQIGNDVPFGVSCIIMAHLSKTFDTVKVFCEKSGSYEAVSI